MSRIFFFCSPECFGGPISLNFSDSPPAEKLKSLKKELVFNVEKKDWKSYAFGSHDDVSY